MIYCFGEFELDEAQLELRSRGAAQLVPPRVVRALVHLLRHRERAVSRDELVEVVWGGLAVSDAALSQTILLARKATREDMIKTVRGHGFRFAAQVTEVERGRASPVAPKAVSDDVLFGRAREQALLAARLELAERGRGSLVLVQGAPGIGKTSLVEAFAARAALRGAHVFWGRSWEDGGAPAFWPFIQVLRALGERYGRDTVSAWLDERCRDLLFLVPELARPGTPAVSEANLEAPQAQFRVFDALTRVLRRMGHALHRESALPPLAAPAVLIALDDLHAADDASVHFLRFLSADLRDAPLLVIGTFRDLEVTPACALASLLGGPLENTHKLTLSGLELPDSSRLLHRLLGHEPAARTAAQLHALSSGNPFLLSELARYAQGDIELSALGVLHVPERMAKAVRRRLDGLSESERALLELASVLGVEFPVEQLRAASARTTECLLRDLDPALRNGTLEPVAGSAGARLRFVHALVRDTLYGELPLARRVALHRSVAESLEANATADAARLYELAHHYYLAVPAGLAHKASDYARKAAAQAARVLAFDTAANLHDRAVELFDAAHESQVSRWELLLEAGHAWFAAGELDRATARYVSAAQHARAHQNAELFATAVLMCIRVRRGFTLFNPELTALIGEALHMQAPGDGMLKALLIGFRGGDSRWLSDSAERDAATREAVDMARRLGDDGALTMTLMFRCWLTLGTLPLAQSQDFASEAVLLARRTGNDQVLLEGLFWRMHVHLVLGEVALAERDLAEYCALAERTHHVLHLYWAQAFHAMRYAWSGDFATAAQLSEAACARGVRIQEPLAVEVHAIECWNASSLQGKRFAQAWPTLLVSHEGMFSGRAREIEQSIAAGEMERARSLFDALAHHSFTDIPLSPVRLWLLAVLATSCARLDDRPRAQCLYDLLSPYAELNVLPSATWIYLGPVAEYLGQLANCLGERALAASHFERAIAECSKLGARPQLARVRFQYAQTLRALPGASQERVAQLLQHVATAADELGTARSFALPLLLNHEDEK